jgi:hypothetical protein
MDFLLHKCDITILEFLIACYAIVVVSFVSGVIWGFAAKFWVK